MMEDENQDVAAALAKLAEQDAGAADDAGAALEWIVGDQGLSVLTQERVQNFCWYELAVKWMTGLDHKIRIASALALALDLLHLPRYADICRSPATRDILAAYETSIEAGKSAYRRAVIASGVSPPDLPEFVWGAVMGWQEAAARSSAAEFLEVAVASGDLVPGGRGWKTCQQELLRAHLTTPQPGLLGQPLTLVILTERAETWVNARRSQTRRRILGAIANRLLHPADLPAEAAAGPLPQWQWLLGELADGIALTQTGNLSRAFVQDNAARFGWDFARPPRTEDDLYDLHQLRYLAQQLRLARRAGRTLVLTAKGRHLLADPEQLWRVTAAGLLGGNDFSVFAGELLLARLVDADRVPSSQITLTVGQAADEEGFRENRTGEPPDRHDIGRAIHHTSNLCRALGLLTEGGDWDDRSYGLTTTGKAIALEALRARATGPRTIPWS